MRRDPEVEALREMIAELEAALESCRAERERLRGALREAVQFIRAYPLGTEDRDYELRRDRILCSEVIRDWLAAIPTSPAAGEAE
jgi:hypothetical protein